MTFSALFGHDHPIALYWSDHSLTILLRDRHGAVLSFARMEIPDGVLEGGVIVRRHELLEVVRACAMRARPSPLRLDRERPVVLAIPEARTFTHLFSITHTGKEGLAEAIKAEAERIIPMDLSRVYYDWRIVGVDGGKTKVLFVGTLREIVDGYVTLVEELGFVPVAIDMEPAALARVLLPKEEGASAILDVGARGTTFACFGEDGGLELSVSISTGGNALSDALIDHAGVGEEEAHRLKSEEGFRLDAPGGGRTLLVLQEGAQSIVREVNQALAYYEGTYGKKIARIVLAGGSSLIPLFDRYLSANLGHPVALGDPSRRLSLPSAVQGAIPTIQLAPVFGLALRAEGRIPENDGINLLHGWEGERWAEREAKIIGRWKSVAIPLFSASALLLAYVLYAYLYAPHVRLREEASSRVAPFLDIDDRHRESAIPIAQEEGATTTVAESDPVAGGSVGDESGDATTTSVVRVGETPTGWLNVRSGPGVTFDVLTRVVPGDRLSLLAREGEWAEVMLPDGESGWVSGEYIVDDHDE